MSKYYGVYLAYSKYEVLPQEMCEDVNVPRFPPSIARTRIYDNKLDQLEAYANTMCSDSQTFEADTLDEANQKIKEFKKNFLDENWLKENIDL